MSVSNLLPRIIDDWSAASNGFYQCRRLAAAKVAHGVSTRGLGNMKDPDCRAKALESAGARDGKACFLKQAHGAAIWEAGPKTGTAPEGDGWVCADPAFTPCVFVADCLPIFVWDRNGKAAVGIFHAGWRGLASGMPRAAVRAFNRYGLAPDRLSASVGPHVGPCCYEVGREVADRFNEEARVAGGSADRYRLDLGREAHIQLTESGIPAEEISISSACTSCRSSELFSYRREKMDQRMLAFIRKP